MTTPAFRFREPTGGAPAGSWREAGRRGLPSCHRPRYLADNTCIRPVSVDPRFHFFLQVLFEQHVVKLCYSDRDVQLDFSKGTHATCSDCWSAT
jgi:hypothetical protein